LPDLISRYEEYQKQIFGDFGIKEGHKVLDVGYGDRSFPLATHAIDPIEDDAEKFYRTYPLQILEGVEYYKCYIEKTPFQNKYFDFVYCSHVLEHIENPEKACKELMRVAKRGYIESPSRLNEVLFGHSPHRWIIEVINNTLFFQKLKDWESMHILSDDMWKAWVTMNFNKEPKNPMETVFRKLEYMRTNNPQSFYTMFQWEDSFEFKIVE